MSRNHEKLKVFELADQLALDVYRATTGFPPEERFGLQSQMRRAAISVSTNIVEGAARRTTRDYVKSLDIALASATETRYLLSLSERLCLLPAETGQASSEQYGGLLRALQPLIAALERRR
jgi:four helix bundle protein